MSLILKRDFGTNLGIQYSMPFITDTFSAVQWVEKIFHDNFLHVFGVAVSDGKSFHDGTASRCISTIVCTEEFIAKLNQDNIESISLDATFKGVPFVIGVSLMDYSVNVVFQKNVGFDIAELEAHLSLL